MARYPVPDVTLMLEVQPRIVTPHCPSCLRGVQCVACYLDSLQLARDEEEAALVMEGWQE